MTTHTTELEINPFSVKTPENLSAQEVVDLFVPYPEFQNLQESGHQFLHGHRGSGKSMMLRMMSPDSQMLSRKCKVCDLPYFGIYLSIKATELNAPEYKRLDGEIGGTVLSEHVLTTKLLSALFQSVEAHCVASIDINQQLEGLRQFINSVFLSKLKYAGWESVDTKTSCYELESASSILRYAITLIDSIHSATVQYIKRRSLTSASTPYQGVLLGFQDVLIPIVKALSEAGIIPSIVYFLLDDADNLTKQQTQVLNTWVSYRTTDKLSLKISTQLNYKTYQTTSGIMIEEPHDFSSINFTSVHTGSTKERYPKFIADIVSRRLKKHGSLVIDPYVFFPEDEKQNAEIKKIEEEYKEKWKRGQSGASRPRDDAYRNARPEFMRRLSGKAKQGAQYKYAGFEQLVHISSGIIRFFLEPASRMYTEQQSKNDGMKVTEISPAIQDQELRKYADQFLLVKLDDLKIEEEDGISDSYTQQGIQKLQNMINGIGALFKAHIMDETASQRRVFSFSISDEVDPELDSILKLGVIHGYFYIDSIGSKSGFGRRKLYVLTRRLAPAFYLDPSGFSGYLTLTNAMLKEISAKPQTFIYRLRRKGLAVIVESNQLSLMPGDLHV